MKKAFIVYDYQYVSTIMSVEINGIELQDYRDTAKDKSKTNYLLKLYCKNGRLENHKYKNANSYLEYKGKKIAEILKWYSDINDTRPLIIEPINCGLNFTTHQFQFETDEIHEVYFELPKLMERL